MQPHSWRLCHLYTQALFLVLQILATVTYHTETYVCLCLCLFIVQDQLKSFYEQLQGVQNGLLMK